MAKIAFIGLGVMGYPMAGHLVAAGHEVVGFDCDSSKAEHWAKEHGSKEHGSKDQGGKIAASPSEAAAGAEFVLACVGGDDDVRSATLGDEGAFAAMDAGSVFVDHTTASASLARELGAKASACGIGFMDAPVSGGSVGAAKGILMVMCGGDADTFARLQDIIACYGRVVKRIGDVGSGQQAKMVNQICLAGAMQGVAEAMNFGQRAGLDMDVVLDVISGGAARSWALEICGAKMLRDDFSVGFAVDWMIKDLGMCVGEAGDSGAQLPITSTLLDYYKQLSAGGDGRNDMSTLIKRLRD